MRKSPAQTCPQQAYTLRHMCSHFHRILHIAAPIGFIVLTLLLAASAVNVPQASADSTVSTSQWTIPGRWDYEPPAECYTDYTTPCLYPNADPAPAPGLIPVYVHARAVKADGTPIAVRDTTYPSINWERYWVPSGLTFYIGSSPFFVPSAGTAGLVDVTGGASVQSIGASGTAITADGTNIAVSWYGPGYAEGRTDLLPGVHYRRVTAVANGLYRDPTPPYTGLTPGVPIDAARNDGSSMNVEEQRFVGIYNEWRASQGMAPVNVLANLNSAASARIAMMRRAAAALQVPIFLSHAPIGQTVTGSIADPSGVRMSDDGVNYTYNVLVRLDGLLPDAGHNEILLGTVGPNNGQIAWDNWRVSSAHWAALRSSGVTDIGVAIEGGYAVVTMLGKGQFVYMPDPTSGPTQCRPDQTGAAMPCRFVQVTPLDQLPPITNGASTTQPSKKTPSTTTSTTTRAEPQLRVIRRGAKLIIKMRVVSSGRATTARVTLYRLDTAGRKTQLWAGRASQRWRTVKIIRTGSKSRWSKVQLVAGTAKRTVAL